MPVLPTPEQIEQLRSLRITNALPGNDGKRTQEWLALSAAVAFFDDLREARERLEASAADFKERLGECQTSRAACTERFEEAEQDARRLREAMRPILAAYRSKPGRITREQITDAWTAFDALNPEGTEHG